MRTGRLLAAACLFAVSAGWSTPVSATAETSTVTIRVLGSSGAGRTLPALDAQQLYATYAPDVSSAKIYNRNQQGTEFLVGDNVSGVSILRLIADAGAVSSHVASVGIVVPGGQSDVLHPEYGDLNEPDQLPFHLDVPPLLSLFNGDINFFVSYRDVPRGVGGPVDNGLQATATNGNDMTITIQLTGPLLTPTVTGPTTVTAGEPVSFTGSPTPAGTHWSWNFGDSPNQDPQDTSTPTHTFASQSKPYTVHVRATATGPGGASGLSAPFDVTVDPAQSTSPTSTSPKPSPTPTKTQPRAGGGAPTNPDAGPQDGNGPRVGGVPTDRGGTGAPGNTYEPRPSGVAATATASDGAVRANGEVVGYVLSVPTRAVAQAQQGAKKARDDSAPAARDGIEPVRLSGWTIAVVAVVALLALGAGSERRRPTFTRARRKQ